MTPTSVIVHDTNREALGRRVSAVRAAAPHVAVTGVVSRTAAVLLAGAAAAGTVLLIDLMGADRVGLDRPGERLIRRLTRSPSSTGTVVYAWSAHVVPEVVHGVRQAGAHGFVVAALDEQSEREQLLRALDHEALWPLASEAAAHDDDGRWMQWFEERFGLAWEPWIEPMLVRLAAGEERAAVADELVDLAAARSRNHASARMREVARAVAGEHSNSPAAVAQAAALVLSQIASQRPLVERPTVAVSLEHGASTIRTSPSLIAAAGLTPEEIADILAMDALIRAKRLADSSGAGAPPADRVRSERRWAAGRRAMDYGAGREDVDAVITGILERLEEALVAVDDARRDELYHPEARTAAGLQLVKPSEAGRVEGLAVVSGRVMWRGRDPIALATDDGLPVRELRALSGAIDQLVLKRSPVRP
jgi:DNA-binding NarL/FixJ family response regulator